MTQRKNKKKSRKNTSKKVPSSVSENSSEEKCEAIDKLAQKVISNPEVVDRVLHDKSVRKQIIQHASQFSGPLPPPNMLERYDAISPGFANRIVTMAEKEQANRHAIDTKQVDFSYQQLEFLKESSSRGQNYGLIAVLAIVTICFYMIYLGHVKTAGFVLTTILVALGGAFFIDRQYKSNISGVKKDESSE